MFVIKEFQTTCLILLTDWAEDNVPYLLAAAANRSRIKRESEYNIVLSLRNITAHNLTPVKRDGQNVYSTHSQAEHTVDNVGYVYTIAQGSVSLLQLRSCTRHRAVLEQSGRREICLPIIMNEHQSTTCS